MCLSIPGKIISIEGETAIASVGGTEVEANIRLVEDVKIGEYVLIHSGFALQKISDEEAQETIHFLKLTGNI